jgi:hypothetical protein
VKLIRENCPLLEKLQSHKQNIIREKLRLKIVLAWETFIITFFHSYIRFTDDFITRIKHEIRSKLSPRHIPAKILQTQDIPHTTNGKKVEVAVKRILAGEHVEHRVAYRNPQSLDLYYNLKELEDL